MRTQLRYWEEAVDNATDKKSRHDELKHPDDNDGNTTGNDIMADFPQAQTSKLVEVEKLLHSANVMHSTQEISGGWEKAREGVPVHSFFGNGGVQH